MRSDFHISYTDEPHATRRKQILAKHPEIESLYGPDMRPLPFVLCIIASQLYLGSVAAHWSWPAFLFVAWTYGGAASHALSLMTHELSHNLMFKTPVYNSYFGIFCNIGMGFPSSTMFKRYHMEHHQYQGHREKDMDLPTHWEGVFFTNAALKALWLLLQPAFYALRPTIVRPKKPMKLDILNNVVILGTNSLIAYFVSPYAVLYLVLSTLLGMGFHPVAGHFIAEHYVFVEGHETYSYYGALNYLCWNVGYHNEHHDFPKVAGWNLPKVTEMAPEFYRDLPQHKSWTMVLVNYIFDPTIGPFSRVIRNRKGDKKSD